MHNLKPKKHLGQHFLKDQHIAWQIVEQLSATDQDMVVEIGPGKGILTDVLVKKYTQLKVVELDREAVQLLSRRFKPDSIEIIHEDVLKWDLKKNLKADTFFIGNLPYNISSPFFFRLLQHIEYVKEGVFMIQKEVAERICASKGNKIYGILSVLLGAYFQREYLFSVPPDVFHPPPRVMSGVIKLTRKQPSPSLDFPKLKKLVKAAFNQRRKRLKNALKTLSISDFEQKEQLLQLRAEQLAIEDFILMANYFD